MISDEEIPHAEPASSPDEEDSIIAADDCMTIDRWPIVDVCFPAAVTRGQLNRHFRALRYLLRKEEPFVIIVDMDQMRTQSRELRDFAATELKDIFKPPAADVVLAVAHICDHWLGHAVLTIVRTVAPPAYQNRLFRRRAMAEEWVQNILAKNQKEL